MLMLSRKKDESFVIEVGDEVITVTVTNVHTSQKQVQIGISAPNDYKIWRSEIYESILENKTASAHQIAPNKLRNFFAK